jgi:hypothetical protein
MGSTSMIVGEVIAPTSPAEVSTPSAARGGESTLVSTTGGEVTTPVVWTSLGPLPRWVLGPTTRWAPGTTRLVPHST